MVNKSVTLGMGLLGLVLASVTGYVIFNTSSVIQGKPEQTALQNYSTEIGMLRPQVNNLSNTVSSLSGLKGDIADIKGKLSDLETKINQSQPVVMVSNPTIDLQSSIYFPGDFVHMTVTGFNPQEVVGIQLLDSSDDIVTQELGKTDGAGRLTYYLQLPSTLLPGNFQVRLISGQQTVSQPIRITSIQNSGSVSLTGLSYTFTAQTDKILYHSGDVFEVFGIGTPNSNVDAKFTSPFGNTYTSSATVQPDGTYALYSTSQFFEPGDWSVTVNNQGLTRILYYVMESSDGVSSSLPLTVYSQKTFYIKGEPIQITGLGKPYTTIKADLTSPSETTYHIATTAAVDGSYTISFPTSPYYETGNWHITVTNWQVSRVVSVYLEP